MEFKEEEEKSEFRMTVEQYLCREVDVHSKRESEI